MSDALSIHLRRWGNLARTSDLIALGHSRSELQRAVDRGDAVRLCKGWIATREASQDAVLAVANAGKLTSSSALKSMGLWDGGDAKIHIAVPPNAPRTTRVLLTPIARFRPVEFPRVGVVRHWRPELAPGVESLPWRVSPTDALVAASHHVPADQFVACLDSALHERALSRAGLPRLRALLPHRMRSCLAIIDPTAESGLESLARVRLAPVVGDIRTQFPIEGIAPSGRAGRVDILIDGWLVIELDGDRWHDPVMDRERDSTLVRQGYRSHRFGYRQVMERWRDVEATVLELLRYPPRGS